MPRTVRWEVPNDTSLFTPHQLQPRAVGELAMSGWARWLRAHVVSFPKLIREHGVGVVVVGAEIEYLTSFGFLEADAFDAEAAVFVRKNGALFEVDLSCSAGGTPVVRVTTVVRTVLLADTQSLAATPGELPQPLLERFQPDERRESARRHLAPQVNALEASPEPLGAASRPFVVHRHLCEVADQWSFIIVPDLASEGREHLALASGAKVPSLRKGVSRPIKKIQFELSKPFYAFEHGTLETRAWSTAEGLAFVHTMRSPSGVHATVVETL